jgi:hypothetical protein
VVLHLLGVGPRVGMNQPNFVSEDMVCEVHPSLDFQS